jgi:hypothetical protein
MDSGSCRTASIGARKSGPRRTTIKPWGWARVRTTPIRLVTDLAWLCTLPQALSSGALRRRQMDGATDTFAFSGRLAEGALHFGGNDFRSVVLRTPVNNHMLGVVHMR